MSANLVKLERDTARETSPVCYCDLCCPQWNDGPVSPAPAPERQADDGDEPSVSISLTEWVERSLAPLTARR